MFAAITCGLILLIGADVSTLVPLPILGGLLAYLGVIILKEALFQSPAQRSLTDLLLAGAIMAVIIYSGYLLGVVLGVVGACLLFALSYSRIGVIRRHLTRAEFASNVDRPSEHMRLLREHGHRIHVFWLSGFIFFGSSNGLFERVRKVLDEHSDTATRYLILDFSEVPGLDTSAVLSLVKLKNYCDERGAVLVFSGLTEKMHRSFSRSGFFDPGSPHRVFSERSEALEWCEEELLKEYELGQVSDETFESWLQGELGEGSDIARITAYFERHEFAAGEAIFEQGAPADSVDLLAAGSVAIVLRDDTPKSRRLRRMAAQTVIGEMGFYRNAPRAAGVIAETPSIVYRLTRQAFADMQKRDPEAASAFHRMIIRLLADRLDFANREISALR
ncbi:MAG: STAS domain-containing protein [Alphaproteobacteria bacterium]|nr:MAG: STAS domain-containing protein [Alphaproteobacteria bacterium]